MCSSDLSFPMPGWTLAADVPAAVPGLLKMLDQLDEAVAAAGGRIYLAKDARQSPEMFRRGYPDLAMWKHRKHELDLNARISSSMQQRIGF